MGLNEKIQFANRKAVGAGGKRQLVVQPPSEKSGEERRLMEKALKSNENIQTMAFRPGNRLYMAVGRRESGVQRGTLMEHIWEMAVN